MNYEPWPPPRDRRYESYSEMQILHWIETVGPILDDAGKTRLNEALANRRAGGQRLHQNKDGYVARKVKRVKRRRAEDPPQPTNGALAKSGVLGGVGSGISLGTVLIGLEVYEKVKDTGIVWDAVWLLSMIGKVFAGIEWGFGDLVALVAVVFIGGPIVVGLKLVK